MKPVSVETINLEVFRQFPVLHTPRLLLRQLNVSDSNEIFAIRSNPNVNRFIGREEMQESKTAEQLINDTLDRYKTHQSIAWAAELRGNTKIIGACGFNRIEHHNLRAELGGELSPEYWGKNIALEAVKEIIRFGLNEMNLHSIEARIQSGNLGAVHLVEKLGFVKEGHFRDHIYFKGKFHDLLVYSKVKETRSS